VDSDGPNGQTTPEGPAGEMFMVERGPGVTVLHLRGDVDAAAAPTLRTVLAEIVEEAVPLLRIDMAAVDFIDSVGISVLVAAYNRTVDRNLAFEVAAVPEGCLRVFEITRLTDVFTIVP
jgi:anti-sigma B factor antagonist